ncbi:hypothetical protein AXF42_Ash004718 [Apostasia shenzhenica]|uniref:Uncharacterized protein n=1 Tax=Apostasia shenzhenica TaxID=1088818 RepID=A0A2I0BHE8_9ASPA|nr:hypothetical protein AXF42_Ash004718 [Apostasia shenzhenica]
MERKRLLVTLFSFYLVAAAARATKEDALVPPVPEISLPRVSAAGVAAETTAKGILEGRYKPLLLNLLPRGKIPPSGPSTGTNEMNS